MHTKGVMAFECFVAEITGIDELSGKVNSFQVILDLGWNLGSESAK
jgi:hypothetical protein